MNKLKSNPKIGKHVDSMLHALREYADNALQNSSYVQTAQGMADLAKAANVKPVVRVTAQKGDTMKDLFKKFNARRKHRSGTEMAASETQDILSDLFGGKEGHWTDEDEEEGLSDEEFENFLAAI
jgi:hypothetical protein